MRPSSIALLSWLVLVAIGLQLGRFASFEFRRLMVRKEVKQQLKAGVPENERAYFTFTQAEYDALKWIKPDKEFTLGAGFFDVIEREVGADGKIHLTCMNDRQEAALFADLSRMVDGAMDHKGDGPQRTQLLFGLLKHWTVATCTWRCAVPELPAVQLLAEVHGDRAGYPSTWWTPPRG